MPFIKVLAPAATGRADQVQDAATHADPIHALRCAPDAAQRRTAAQALAAHPGAVPALLAALADETAPPVRSAVLDTLSALAAKGSEDAVAGLADCLRSEDAWLRNAAIDLLRELPAQVAPVMAHLLVDWDRDVRILAVGILDQLRHERVEEWLLQLIEADADVNVCGAALDVLAEVATPAAAGPVERLAERFASEPYILFTARLVKQRLNPEVVVDGRGDGVVR